MRYFYIIVLAIFLSACSFHDSLRVESVKDLKDISQDVDVYTKNIDARYISKEEDYKNSYFKPWNIKKVDISLKEAMWAYRILTPKKSYGENLQHIKKEFFDKILDNSNFNKFATVNQSALTLKHLNLRAFPTQKPIFKDPKLAGEGFPFDYLQNSTIEANKPILISHYSKDKEWVFIEASFAYGWVKSDSIVKISKNDKKIWMNTKGAFVTKDGVPVYDKKHNFLFRTHIGMMLPLVDSSNGNVVFFTASKNADGFANIHTSKLNKEFIHPGILLFNEQNINIIINELKKVKYGWGGMYGDRDCSSTMRDFFAPFGVWLPRNSFRQSKVGKIISLNGLTDKKKIETIKKHGVAFETLLYKHGHIVLYAGTFNNKVVVFQNLWGIKTKKDNKAGRFIIGKSVFSTLEIGKNLKYYDSDASLLHKLASMNIVTKK